VVTEEVVTKPYVLVIDDDPRILRALRLVLRADYEVLIASCLSEARSQLESAKVDVVLCDQRMPDGLGSEFLALIAKERPHVGRLLHSGSPPDDVPALIQSGSIHGLLLKPASVTDLRSSIENLRKR